MSIYCVYLTVYRGNKLPPFYIGSTSVQKVLSGYNGSVRSKRFKQAWDFERKHNKHLFETKIIKKFSSRKDALLYEGELQKRFDVFSNELYINMHIANPNGIHGYSMVGKNNPMYGSSRTGEANPFYNKTHTDETKRLISIANSGRKYTTEQRDSLKKSRAKGIYVCPWGEYTSIREAHKHKTIPIERCDLGRLFKTKSDEFYFVPK